MSNKIGQPDAVITSTDKLVQSLLTKAMEAGADLDFQLSVVQASTRWVATKNKLSVPEEDNQFDRFRAALDGAPASAPAGSVERAPRAAAGPRRRPNGNLTTSA